MLSLHALKADRAGSYWILLLDPCLQFGCLVVNAPTANTIAAAEHGIALLCAMARNIPQADASMKQSKWDRNKYVGTSLTGKTVAVIGFGKVSDELRNENQ